MYKRQLKYSDDFSKAQGLNQLWKIDAATTAVAADNAGFSIRHKYLIQLPTTKCTFSFRVPLKHIFGFCDDYDKIVYGLKHTLTRFVNQIAMQYLELPLLTLDKVSLDKISWFIPHVLPADAEKFPIYKDIESKVSLPAAYRTRQCDTITVSQSTTFSWRLGVKNAPEKPRWIIIAFRTEKSGDQTKNPAIFDHVNVNNIYVTLNSTRYPAVDYNLSFANQQFSRAYGSR